MKLSELKLEGLPSIFYRAGTSDEQIIQLNTGDQSEYHFPEDAEPKCIMDIGANIGIISVVLANLYPDAKIFSFEPDKDNFEILKKNTENYKNVTIYNAALSNYEGEGSLWYSDDPINFGGHSMHMIGCDTNREPQIIKVMDVFSFLETIEQVDLIKIDTEGSEHNILANMFPFLQNVQYLVGELHGQNDLDTLKMLSHHFDLGFQKHMRHRLIRFFGQKKQLNG